MSAVTFTLSGSIITIDPPQHLLALWIRDEVSGQSVTVSHESGYEAKGEVVMSRPVPGARPTGPIETEMQTPLSPEYLATFPLVSRLDLGSLPAEYRRFGSQDEAIANFKAGGSYVVDLVGDQMCSAAVIAQ